MKPLYSKQAVKYLSNLDASSQQRIRQGISKIPEGDIRPLKGAPGNYRLRVLVIGEFFTDEDINWK